MKCFKPLQGYRVFPPDEKPFLTFKDKFKTDLRTEAVEVRCGNCIGCRLTKSRDWAIRIAHEATQHKENSFITLTYAEEHLPAYGGLNPDDWTMFMHRLRKRITYKDKDKKIRFYMCGEYGTDENAFNKIGRPHFHAIIFGHDFTDDRLFKEERKGNKTYVSPMLDQAWGKGLTEIGNVTFESASYVAGYVVKKINGDAAKDHYLRVNQVTGEAVPIKPEYARMSRGGRKKGTGGIGAGWYEKYSEDLEKGFITIGGKKRPIPQYYRDILKERNPEALERVEERAKMEAKKQDRWNLEAEEHQQIKMNERSRRTI